MTSQIIAMLAAAGMVTAGVAATSETRAPASLPALAAGASGGQCTINVIRTGAAGTANIYRQQLENGSCVCNIVTGPAAANGSAENAVRQLQQAGECPGAPPPAAEAAGAGGGLGGTTLGVLVGIVGASGLVVALSKKSPG